MFINTIATLITFTRLRNVTPRRHPSEQQQHLLRFVRIASNNENTANALNFSLSRSYLHSHAFVALN